MCWFTYFTFFLLSLRFHVKLKVIFLKQPAEDEVAEDNQAMMEVDNSESSLFISLNSF